MEEYIEILKKTKAVLNGHFLLSSGLHSDTYIQCALALKYPQYVRLFALKICEHVNSMDIDMVISPALGGIIIGFEVARTLNKPFIFTEKEDGGVKLRRGFEIERKNYLIVEDVFTTGKSTLEVCDIVKNGGGKVVGAASIVKRGDVKFYFPYFSLIDLKLITYPKSDCPMCKNNIPIVKPGSRKIIDNRF